MQIKITHLFAEDSAFVPFDLSNNQATLGADAARLTWNASKECAAAIAPPLLDTDEKRSAFKEFVNQSGFSEADEMDTWPDNELQALCLQWIAGDVREAFGDSPVSEWDWADYQERSERGQVSSTLFRDNAGEIYFDFSY